MDYKKFESIKKNNEFQKVYNNKNSYANNQIVIYIINNKSNISRLGISVSKKIGNSVVRHRLTRVIKEIFRLNKNRIKLGYDIVVLARKGIIGISYFDIKSSILYLLKKHKLICDSD